jgi:HAD superfamily hydrolase (TIGR01509 family)
MASIKALLFDVDGTLVDSNDFHVRAWHEVFRDAGYDLPAPMIHAQVGKGGDNLVPSLLPDLSEAEHEKIAEAHGPLYRARYMEQVKPFPAARDLLARAKADGFTVALATSADPEELDHYVELLDARELIDLTTDSSDAKTTKPAPDIFEAALKKAGVSPDAALVIGDSPYDMLAARRAGIGAIGLLSGGFDEQELRDAGALAIYRDAADLLAQWDGSPIKRAQAS